VPAVKVTTPCWWQYLFKFTGQGCVRVGGPRLDELDGQHGSTATDVPDLREVLLHRTQARHHHRLDVPGEGARIVLPHPADRPECSSARHRVSSVGATKATCVHRIHQFRAPGDGSQRHSTGDALGGGDHVGNHAVVGDREPVTRSAKTRLDLICDEHDPVGRCELRKGRQEPGSGGDETALTLDRFDHDRGDVMRAHFLVDLRGRPQGNFLAIVWTIAERVTRRNPVDLGGERSEALLVRHVLRGQRHREVGAPVIAVLEHHHGGALGGVAGDLHSVLYGFGT
jgi:hypothetical protein